MATHFFPKKTIKEVSVRGKRVLVRVDFNVPLNEDGEIESDFRIAQSLPTIKYLLKEKAEVVLLAHLGRPDGEVVKRLSLEVAARYLNEEAKIPTQFFSDCVGDGVFQALKKLKPGTVSLLENVRFHKGEEVNSPEFAKKLIETIQPDYIVQDGFGVVHRAHASTEGISHMKPALAGLLLETEYTQLMKAIREPNRPLVAVIGGAKMADKLPLIERFIEQADTILVGGALANTFLAFSGHGIGKSMYEPEAQHLVEQIMKKAKHGQLLLPVDVAVGTEVSVRSQRRDCGLEGVPREEFILDIGYETMRLYHSVLETAGTVVWNGTLGYAENRAFSQGSDIVAQTLASHFPHLASIIGGGDTADFVLDWQERHHEPKPRFTHISTGGGASLELMSGKALPGIEALLNK